MNFRFAHMADVHLGAFRDPKLRELNYAAFEQAIEMCIESNVDFILISGDLFDSNIPDTKIAERAAGLLKRLKDLGVRVYVIYGSHDYSPTKASMLDIFHSAGLVENLSKEERRIKLIEDRRTGVKLAGIGGRKTGTEMELLRSLEWDEVEAEEGFKIFLFHTAVEELLPKDYRHLESIPLTSLPKGFSYYAGGHVHTISTLRKGDAYFAYPGPLFGYDYRDLEAIAKGERRGFFLVSVEDGKLTPRFIELNLPQVVYVELDANGKSANEVALRLEQELELRDVRDKIVLIRVFGELRSGKPQEINFNKLRERLLERGAIVAYINRNMLTGREIELKVEVKGESKEDIEKAVLERFVKEYRSLSPRYSGEEGVKLALKLLDILRRENVGLSKNEYESSIVTEALHLLLEEGKALETEKSSIIENAKVVRRGQVSLFDFG